ncbi:ATP-binding protein [Nocardia sp. alder85J]|uniref:ATP-binding protein n=1 Tax=Nocardia sp. alder85J TaxID=2862949 RepID=UPI001CD4AF50|nr:ATP-binding protein [Nocardia sp. alder85J]MCX4098047.1 ATP-binding protein [Nocardia sp. alder85J]
MTGDEHSRLGKAVGDLGKLFVNAKCGACQVEQLKPLKNLRQYLQDYIATDELDLNQPHRLYQLLVAVDEYCKDETHKTTIPLFGEKKPKSTETNIVQAVGYMIWLDGESAHSGLEYRWTKAADILGYSRRHASVKRNAADARPSINKPAREEYLRYIARLLGDDVARAEILKLAAKIHAKRLSEVGLAYSGPSEERQGFDRSAELPNWLSVIGETRTSGPPIFERADDIGNVLTWLRGRGQVLLLAGDSGNGKSTIARESLKHIEGDTRIIAIDASTSNTLPNSMLAYLQLSGDESFRVVQQEFVAYLRTLPQRTLLFIDNVPDWGTISDVAETASLRRLRLFVTAEHEHLIPSDYEPELIKVNPPGLNVTLPLVRWFRPTADDDAAKEFAEAVERRPRIIIDCLGMFDEETMSLEDMASSVLDDNAQLLEDAGTHTRSVHKLYGIYFERTLREKPMVALCLMVLAYLAESVTPTSIATESLVKLGKAQGQGTFLKSALTPMLRVLQARFLLEHRHDEIHMHGVTQRLFRQVELAKGYRLAVYQAAIAAYLDRRPDFVEDAVMRPERLLWISPLERVVLTLRPDELLAFDADDSTAVVSDVRQGLIQLGKYHIFKSVVKHLFENNQDFLRERLLSTREGHREYEEWEDGFYNYGTVSRELANKTCKLDIDAKSFRDVLHRVQTMFRYAHASYQLDTFVMWIRVNSEKFYESPHCDAEGRYRIRYTYAKALDWVGRSDEAERLCQETFKANQMPIPQALTIARIGIGCASKCGDVPLMQRWMDLIEQAQTARDEAQVSLADADYLISRGWFHRMMDDNDELRTSRESFYNGAAMLLYTGKRREALETYVESVAVHERWTLKVGTDDKYFEGVPSYSFFKNLDTELDEPHTSNRLRLVRAIADGLRSGFTEESLAGVSSILDEAEQKYKDARTVHQAKATLLYARHALDLEEDPALKQQIFELQKRRLGPQIDVDNFGEWVDYLLHSDPGILLMQ